MWALAAAQGGSAAAIYPFSQLSTPLLISIERVSSNLVHCEVCSSAQVASLRAHPHAHSIAGAADGWGPSVAKTGFLG